jgi:hypothetical protein
MDFLGETVQLIDLTQCFDSGRGLQAQGQIGALVRPSPRAASIPEHAEAAERRAAEEVVVAEAGLASRFSIAATTTVGADTTSA